MQERESEEYNCRGIRLLAGSHQNICKQMFVLTAKNLNFTMA